MRIDEPEITEAMVDESRVTSPLGPGVTTAFLDVGDGNSICWTSQGEGPAVLLAMGRAWPKEMWYRTAPVLARSFRVITFDNRGGGATRWNGKAFGIPDLADDALRVLDAAGIDQAHVYGVSLGGLTAQEIALSHPERVTSLLLGCTGAPDHDRTGEFPPQAPPTMSVEELIRASQPFQYGTDPDPEMMEEDVQVLLNSPPPSYEALEAQSRATLTYVSADRLPALKLPTLVLHGTADKVVPHEVGVELSRLIPDAKMVSFDGAGHCYGSEVPDAANEAILTFLESWPERVSSGSTD